MELDIETAAMVADEELAAVLGPPLMLHHDQQQPAQQAATLLPRLESLAPAEAEALQWAYAARRRLTARMREQDEAFALPEWPDDLCEQDSRDQALAAYLAQLEVATLHAQHAALTALELTLRTMPAAMRARRDFQADMRRAGTPAPIDIEQHARGLAEQTLAPLLERLKRAAQAKAEAEAAIVEQPQQGFARCLCEAPAIEGGHWHAATLADESNGLPAPAGVCTFPCLFVAALEAEPRNAPERGLCDYERRRLQWFFAARQRLVARMQANGLPVVAVEPLLERPKRRRWADQEGNPRLFQCLYAELTLLYALARAVHSHTLLHGASAAAAATAWTGFHAVRLCFCCCFLLWLSDRCCRTWPATMPRSTAGSRTCRCCSRRSRAWRPP